MKKHTPEEIVQKLRRVDALAAQGKTTAEDALKLENERLRKEIASLQSRLEA